MTQRQLLECEQSQHSELQHLQFILGQLVVTVVLLAAVYGQHEYRGTAPLSWESFHLAPVSGRGRGVSPRVRGLFLVFVSVLR